MEYSQAHHEEENVESLDPAAPKLLVIAAGSADAVTGAVKAMLARAYESAEAATAEFYALLHTTISAGASRAPFALCMVASESSLIKELELAAKGVAVACKVP